MHRKRVAEIVKGWNLKLEVASGAIVAGAVVTTKGLGKKETLEEAVFRKGEYQAAALYNLASSPWRKGEASSDFINCGRDSVSFFFNFLGLGSFMF